MKFRLTKPLFALMMLLFCIYGGAYCFERKETLFIHRKTWSNGWNSHWIEAGYPKTTISPLPFAPLHINGDEKYNEGMRIFATEFNYIRKKQKILGFFYFPLRVFESCVWWLFDPKEKQLQPRAAPDHNPRCARVRPESAALG